MDNPFFDDNELTEIKPVALHPNCGGESFYSYDQEFYPDMKGSLMWCSKCNLQWELK